MEKSSQQEPLILSQLFPLDHVQVMQQRLSTSRTVNEYFVTSPDGANLLHAKDDNIFMGPKRTFDLDIFDSQNQEVMSLQRPWSMCDVRAPMAVSVCRCPVSIVQQGGFITKVLSISDTQGRPVLRIKGPRMGSNEAIFDIFTPEKVVVGAISKNWRGAMSEMFSHNDTYQVRFPADLDVRFKAVLIGTCMFLDFLYTKN